MSLDALQEASDAWSSLINSRLDLELIVNLGNHTEMDG